MLRFDPFFHPSNPLYPMTQLIGSAPLSQVERCRAAGTKLGFMKIGKLFAQTTFKVPQSIVNSSLTIIDWLLTG